MSANQPLSRLIKPLAYTLFAISTIAWVLVFVIPFLDFSIAETAGIITALIIVGEVSFYIAILLLGKPVWNKFKQKLADYIKQKND
ncbi:hypothetical protein THMIRHAM_09560 [Thiomicrorhabdus immobilis]|uniref:Transporter suffix domain-containing protein n=1 Tax=Thiomicrorhabdus immobilis TaxID=2791037 RepID=A0ABN6CVX8_9GAMM|nr:transporter suffix domain-containing protein [Thiomicrorhabdus immobilis]BCN93171.1 hypothetical protein THMIRHAM_09560 [Thiomicrorhabdus immobilis]